jgi:hypothetical protein
MLVMGLAPSLWLPSIEQGVHWTRYELRITSQPGPFLHPSALSLSSQGEGQR